METNKEGIKTGFSKSNGVVELSSKQSTTQAVVPPVKPKEHVKRGGNKS